MVSFLWTANMWGIKVWKLCYFWVLALVTFGVSMQAYFRQYLCWICKHGLKMTSLRASDDTNAPPTKFQLVICVCGKLYYSWHTTQIVCAHGEKFVQILGHYMIIIVLVSIKSETHNFSTHDTITHNVKFCVCIFLILWHWFYNCPQSSNIWSIRKDRC